jgi:hypothetical protein
MGWTGAPQWKRLPSDGGCPFPCAPDLDPEGAPALWKPDLSTAIVVLDAAPIDATDALPVEPAALGEILTDVRLSSGRHLVIDDGLGRHRLWLRNSTPGMHLAFVVANDARFDLRTALAKRLWRRMRGDAAGPLPPKCKPTPYQRHRLAQLLALLDADQAGATRQDMATLVTRGWCPLSSLDWQNSSMRRRVHRLVKEAVTLMNGGYRRLLRLDGDRR